MGGDLVLLALLVAVFAVFVGVARNRRLRSELRSETVDLRVDEFGARREMADGRVEEVEWTELREVSVLVTNRGPHRAHGGVIILWGDETRGCLVPIDRAEDSGLVGALGRLPGFETSRLVAALEEKPVSQTTVWSAEAVP